MQQVDKITVLNTLFEAISCLQTILRNYTQTSLVRADSLKLNNYSCIYFYTWTWDPSSHRFLQRRSQELFAQNHPCCVAKNKFQLVFIFSSWCLSYLVSPLLAIKSTMFKGCVRYFLSFFKFFIKWTPFKNYEKCFLFHLKSSFCSRGI